MAKRIVWTAQARADVRQLTGIDPPELRLRIGDYRVRFYNHTDWVEILRVRHRSQAYR